MTKTVAVLATLDTKGQEADYLREQITRMGSDVLIIDIGVTGEAAAGGITKDHDLGHLTQQRGDQGVERRGVAGEVAAHDRRLLALEHHRHAVIGPGSRN